MSFIADATLKTDLAAALGQAEADLDSRWTTIVADANAQAYQDILARLAARGYTKTQIDQWQGGASMQGRLGLYWCAVRGAQLHAFQDEWTERLRVSDEEWASLAILDAGGDLLLPAGRVSHGECRRDDEVFRDHYRWDFVKRRRGAFRPW